MNSLNPTNSDLSDPEALEEVAESGMTAEEGPDPTTERPQAATTQQNAEIIGDSSKSELLARLQDRINVLNPLFADKEQLKLNCIVVTVNEAYQRSWSSEANKTFRQIVTFSKRMRRIKKGLRSN